MRIGRDRAQIIKRDVEELLRHRLEPLEQVPSRRLACRHVGQNQRAPAPAARGKRLQQAIAVDEAGGLVVDDDDRKIGPFDKAGDDRRDSGRRVDHQIIEFILHHAAPPPTPSPPPPPPPAPPPPPPPPP